MEMSGNNMLMSTIHSKKKSKRRTLFQKTKMKKETKDFYLLYPNLLDCTLQYFDDTKRGKSA